jgi:hypothetical protein
MRDYSPIVETVVSDRSLNMNPLAGCVSCALLPGKRSVTGIRSLVKSALRVDGLRHVILSTYTLDHPYSAARSRFNETATQKIRRRDSNASTPKCRKESSASACMFLISWCRPMDLARCIVVHVEKPG